jgi:DNA-binding IclR family transcriptional regulator
MNSQQSDDVVPRTVARVLDLLEIVLSSGPCNLTSAATEAELTPTTALRHLRALEARGYVDRDEQGLFSAGPTIVRIGAALNDGGPLARLLAVAQPHLDELARCTGESTYLAVSDGRTATYVATAESTRAIRHVGWVGQNVTLNGTAVGEALRTPGTPIIRTGAVEPDITAVSCALDSGSEHTATLGVAVSVVGPSHRLSPDTQTAAVDALVDAVRRLTNDLTGTLDERRDRRRAPDDADRHGDRRVELAEVAS